MPNGVSCAFFAVKNAVTGTKENNVFKEGIAALQSARMVDTAVQCDEIAGSMVNSGVKSGLSKIASFARKLLYPLIIMSGVYNTVKSDDKVKTGVTQACAISNMYLFEKVTEKILKSLDKKVKASSLIKNNKPARYAWYVLKGLMFASASIAGYTNGNKYSGKAVEALRAKKQDKFLNEDIYEPEIFEEFENEIKAE